ncbi:MAG: L,D-transpeptidase family protein [Bacteroidota bacterium]
MKKLIYLFGIVCLAVSCDTNTKTKTTHTEDSEENEIVKPVSLRDTSITPAVAYNNFFIDSAAVMAYVTKNNLPAAEANRIQSFYNQRNFQFAWFTNNGPTEEGRNFWNAYTYEKTKAKDTGYDRKLVVMMDTLLPSLDTIVIDATDSTYVNAEIAITRKFLNYYTSREDGTDNNLLQLVPTRKADVLASADSILKTESKIVDTNNLHRQYHALKKELAMYLQLAKTQQADSVVFIGKLKKGMSSPVLPVIKKRLQLMGYLPGADTTAVYNDSLAAAISLYQMSLGMKADGILSDSVTRRINIPYKQKVAQILVNMNRLLWMPSKIGDHYIQVNIPEFMLHVYEAKNKVFEMPVVVGKEGTNTMMFAGDLNQVVFSPYWNIPESIVKNEIVPGIERNPDYLASHNMEITGKRNNLPVVRQLPGKGNSLGRVKFLFPNSYDIYLHDTEAKYLFTKTRRAFSHGCIRLADAEKMANYILREDSAWNAEKITEAMNSDTEKFVKVKNPVPVLITYLTVWVDDAGKMNTRDDIYQHDAAAIKRHFISF